MAVIYLLFTGIWEYLQINQKYTNQIFYLSKIYSKLLLRCNWGGKNKLKG